MNILLIAVIAVVILFTIIGYRKGLLGILFNIFSWIFIAFFVYAMNPYILDFINEHTTWQASIEAQWGSVLTDKFSQIGDSLLEGRFLENGDSLLGGRLLENGDSLLGGLVSQLGSDISSSVSSYISSYIMKGISCLIAFLIAKIICWIVYAIIKALQKVPVLHGVASVIGALLGAVKGVLITWLFMYIVTLAAATSFGTACLQLISDSSVLTFLYDNNIIFLI